MCRSVPHTPQAPILISAAFPEIFGHGTVRISGAAPGPAKVQTRICSIAVSSRHFQRGVSHLLQSIERQSWHHVAYREAVVGDVEHCEIGIDALDDADCRQRISAAANEFALA